ncbi:glycosyltransferase family 4 protein [Nostocoides sp. Soil756]|uniref:glycosyltransferase family 4 protein n=1 Tax=Nostocoides sp. Soil756 TaxID=1736399 RepID=UPI0006F7637D|nr:glycosyltransferase family 4 protein [Tetrasphaera sp. Soil756]KRE62284.1 hypothetical protein ASG78_04345 [Tetrasphaera sp. Soil756]
MKVALYHDLPPGGALHVVRDFVAGVPEGVDVDAFTLDTGDGSLFPTRARRVDGARRTSTVRLRPGPSRRLSPTVLATQLPRAEREIARRINEGGYDVAYVHPCWIAYAPGVLTMLTMPTVLYLHEVRRASFEPTYRARPGSLSTTPGWAVKRVTDDLLGIRDRRAVAAADILLCNSVYTAERILACYGRAATVVSPGIDTDLFRPRQTVPERRRGVVVVGGVEPFKDQLLVVRALAAIHSAERPDLTLIFERCNEAYRREVLVEAERSGVVVHELRGVADDTVAEVYSRSAVTVLAARLEPLGLTALESIACGTPVVAVREAGYRETVTEGVNGLLVARSVGALADGIVAVLDGSAALASREKLPDTVRERWSNRTSIAGQVRVLEEASMAKTKEP